MQNQAPDAELKKFAETFFRNFNSNIFWQGDILHVENAPPKFENFVGKRSPYKFAFSPKEVRDGIDLLTRGSYFLIAMSKFLSARSKKTLLKLNVELNPIEEINSRFKFINARIENISQREKYDVMVRFTFSSTLQYRNGKKQETHTIFVKDNKVLPIDFSKYNFIETKDKLARFGKLEEEYNQAKEELKKVITKRTTLVGNQLKPLLEREIAKIKDHSLQQLTEFEEEIADLSDQIKKISERIKKAKGKDKLSTRKDHLTKLLKYKEKEQSNKISNLKREQSAAIENEKYKHSLNVTNKLINTAIIFVPKLTFRVNLKSKNSSTNVNLEYDPIQKHIPPIECKSTGKRIYEPYLCAGGELCDKSALGECFEDGKIYSKHLLKEKCSHSGKIIANKNAKICTVSRKVYGKSYIKKDELTGKDVYINLLSRCPASGIHTLKQNLTPCPNCKKAVAPQAIKKRFNGSSIKATCACCER